ncbi:DUF2059 domain-containing protein [Mucilaginibacter sp. UR6-11]|uniref:DUF2059 domain-containing protein n=1 Tax=Mucilaginibacter sp. UR6-11 TaxID=1435644 RepID=UPI001E5540D3|nr:DUF2059 domain-containing protein [Mucilaginibacter sp. UR6-11]MCC8424972.1 DUF2059 domain-containing protein [Mucilaginibacter sp. UR6-11]
MKFNINLIIITLCFSAFFFNANAQTAGSAITPAHLQAAEKFLVAYGIGDQFKTMTENVINVASNRLPEAQRAEFADVMRKFMAKYYTWDIIKGTMSKIYAQEFDEAELNQLADFYNSPIGKKYAEKMPELVQKGMLMGQQIMAEHKDELVQMIQDKSKQH